MAKDDYDFIKFKVLAYLLGVFKRKYPFVQEVFEKEVIGGGVKEEYARDVLRYMQMDGYIDGLCFKKAWGAEYIIANDLSDMNITSAGINYLQENSSMKKIKKAIDAGVGIIPELVKIVFGA